MSERAADLISSLPRPLLAVGFGAGAIYLATEGKIDANIIAQLAGMIAAFYFGERSTRKGFKEGEHAANASHVGSNGST